MLHQPGQSAGSFAPALRRRARKALAAMVAASLVFVALLPRARASDDCLNDPTFGRDGKVFTNFFFDQGLGSSDAAKAVAVQPDGKIVVAGYSSDAFALARYNANGSLDQSFGSGGKVRHDFTAQYVEYATAVAIQPDGKIVVAGTLIQTGYDFGLLRYNSNGSPDDGSVNDSTPGDSFGHAGQVITNFQSASYDFGMAMVLQPDGKIIVAGGVNLDLSNNSLGYQFALARYNSNGVLDQSFGTGGKVVKRIKDSCSSYANAVALQTDGKIVAGGNTLCPDNNDDFALARYNTNGSPDDGLAHDSTPADSFGTEGKVTTDFYFGHDEASGIVIQPDGKIVLAGTVQILDGSSDLDFGMARYNTDGSVDESFGGGWVVTDFLGDDDIAHGLAVQSNGKLVVAGSASRSPWRLDFALARYTSEGFLDNTFGDDGLVITNILFYDEASAVAIQPDGKIVAAGRTLSNYAAHSYEIALVRYLADGTIPEPKLSSLTLTSNKISGCDGSLIGTLMLCSPAPLGGLTVQLSDNLASASVPQSVIVPEGATYVSFDIATTTTSTIQSGSIVARLGATVRSAPLVIQPAGVLYVSINPRSVTGPRQAVGTVVLSCPAPAGGVNVQVSSDKPAIASPTVSSFTIAAGAQSKTFRISTTDVSSIRRATIKATANGVSKSAVLIVQ